MDFDDATGLAGRIRGGEVSATEAVAAAVARIEERDGALGAVIHRRFAEALGEVGASVAAAAAGPFAGVPLLLKDAGGTLAGLPHHQGNQLLRRLGWVAWEDAPIARRLVDAGFVVVGKTNTPEFAAGPACQPRAYGPTRNPWSADHSPSGSSGGAAAAVAAGLVPLAHGNDFGGSIRTPAAWCGLVGLKPSRGRVSSGAPGPPGANAEFALTRSLRDTAALLDVVADEADGWAASLERGLPSGGRPLRVGVLTGVDGVDVEGRCADAARSAGAALAADGHEVVEVDAGLLADERWEPMMAVIRSRGVRGRFEALEAIAGRPLGPDDAEPLMHALAASADRFTDEEAAAAGRWQLAHAEGVAGRWAALDLDVLCTPATGVPPLRTEELEPPGDDPASIYLTYRRVSCFTAAWNMTGQPALVVPWWDPAEALPVGVQLVADVGREDLLLQVARRLGELDPVRTAVRPPPPG